MGLVLATHLHRCRGHLPPHPLPARTPSGPRSWLYSDSELVSVGPLAPTVPHNATSPTLHEDSRGTAARGRRVTPLSTSPTHRALPLPNATPTPCTETQTHVFQEGPQCPQRPTCSWPAAPFCPCWEPDRSHYTHPPATLSGILQVHSHRCTWRSEQRRQHRR